MTKKAKKVLSGLGEFINSWQSIVAGLSIVITIAMSTQRIIDEFATAKKDISSLQTTVGQHEKRLDGHDSDIAVLMDRRRHKTNLGPLELDTTNAR